MSLWNKHAILEKNSGILVAGIVVAISPSGASVEIVPLFYLERTRSRRWRGMRPYSPLELAGTSTSMSVRVATTVSQPDGCAPCATRWNATGIIRWRPSPCMTGPSSGVSKRTGPDLARCRWQSIPDEWHVRHLIDPRSVRAGIDHAGLSVPVRDAARLFQYRAQSCGYRLPWVCPMMKT